MHGESVTWQHSIVNSNSVPELNQCQGTFELMNEKKDKERHLDSVGEEIDIENQIEKNVQRNTSIFFLFILAES